MYVYVYIYICLCLLLSLYLSIDLSIYLSILYIYVCTMHGPKGQLQSYQLLIIQAPLVPHLMLMAGLVQYTLLTSPAFADELPLQVHYAVERILWGRTSSDRSMILSSIRWRN